MLLLLFFIWCVIFLYRIWPTAANKIWKASKQLCRCICVGTFEVAHYTVRKECENKLHQTMTIFRSGCIFWVFAAPLRKMWSCACAFGGTEDDDRLLMMMTTVQKRGRKRAHARESQRGFIELDEWLLPG